MTSPTADVSVRVAWADDAPAIGALQVRAWRTAYADLLPAEALPDETVATEAWRSSMTRPAASCLRPNGIRTKQSGFMEHSLGPGRVYNSREVMHTGSKRNGPPVRRKGTKRTALRRRPVAAAIDS